jgi:hypothetical protein
LIDDHTVAVFATWRSLAAVLRSAAVNWHVMDKPTVEIRKFDPGCGRAKGAQKGILQVEVRLDVWLKGPGPAAKLAKSTADKLLMEMVCIEMDEKIIDCRGGLRAFRTREQTIGPKFDTVLLVVTAQIASALPADKTRRLRGHRAHSWRQVRRMLPAMYLLNVVTPVCSSDYGDSLLLLLFLFFARLSRRLASRRA